jgi:hypothetical protein
VRVRLKGVDASELLTERGEEANQLMMGIVTDDVTCRLTGEKTWKRAMGASRDRRPERACRPGGRQVPGWLRDRLPRPSRLISPQSYEAGVDRAAEQSEARIAAHRIVARAAERKTASIYRDALR